MPKRKAVPSPVKVVSRPSSTSSSKLQRQEAPSFGLVDGELASTASPDSSGLSSPPSSSGEPTTVPEIVKSLTDKGKKSSVKRGNKKAKDESDEDFYETPIPAKRTKSTGTTKSLPKQLSKGKKEVNQDRFECDVEEPQEGAPVNSDHLPLPWKGRLGYVILLSSPVEPAFANL